MHRIGFILLSGLASLTDAHAQLLVPDKALEVELKASDPPLASHGPSRTFDYEITADGTLHVWATSKDFDPIVRITDSAGVLLAEDDNSGGGTTAYVWLAVSREAFPSITVASADAGGTGMCIVHASAMPASNNADLAAQRLLVGESNAARAAGDYAAARSAASKAVENLLARPESERSTAWLMLLTIAANAAREMQVTGTARVGWEMALEICSRTRPDDHPDMQQMRHNLAMTIYALGDFAGARVLQEKVLEVRSRTLPDDHPDLHWARHNLALNLDTLGDFAGARVLQEKVLEVRSRTRPDDDADLQDARSNLAATIWKQGDLASARALQEKVLEVCSRTLPDDNPRLQLARTNLANTLWMQGDIPGTRALEEKVLEVCSRTLPDDHPQLQSARMNLANTLNAQGDLAGARALHEKALEVYKRTLPDDNPQVLLTRANLASTLLAQGDVQGAQTLCEKAVEVFSRTVPDDNPELQVARMLLAATIWRQGDLPRARAVFEKVLEVYSRTLPGDHPNLQLARANVASILVWQIARGARSAGEEGDRARDKQVWRERCAELIGAACRAEVNAARSAILGSPSREAEERCAHLTEQLDVALSFARGHGVFEPLLELASESLVLSETTRGAALAAAEFTRRAAGASEYAELRKAVRNASEELASLAQKGTTNVEFDRARVRRESAERELATLARELSGGQATGVQFDLESLAARLVPGEAAVAFRRYRKSWVEVRDELDSTGQNALRRIGVDSLCAFVVRSSKEISSSAVNGGAPSKSTPAPALTLLDLGALAPIEAAARAWREAIGVGLERGMAACGEEVDLVNERAEDLRKLVWDPLLPALVAADRVVVVLDDVLHLVPLEALPLADSKELVGDRWRIETRATLTELLTDSPAPSGTALVALGGSSFNVAPIALSAEEVASFEAAAPTQVASLLRGTTWERGFAPLTHTGDEARGIGALYTEIYEGARPALVLEKRKASREGLIELAPKARFLHIATHGWFAPESVRSWSDAEPLDKQTGFGSRVSGREQVKGMSPMLLCGLALAGANLPEDTAGRAPGLVTADELSTLDLSNCELVVLSACDTNVGERRAGQGVASLQKALQMAGARSVITSLWKVPDEATKELMLDFYRRLWVEKKPKHQALWEAKTKLREAQDERGAPKYTTRDWAAWVLTGDPE